MSVQASYPSRSKYYRLLSSPWLIVIVSWGYLSLTQCSELMWFDSGELALAGHSFGLAHPPGQAFYAFLSALSALTPNPLWCLNQLSALSLALSLYPIWLIYTQVKTSAKSSVGVLENHQPKQKTQQIQKTQASFDIGFLLIALIWITLYPVWDQGTRIEVYALANFLGFSTLACLGKEQISLFPRHIFWAGVSLGLCGATQAIFAIAFGLASGSVVYSWVKSSEFIHLRRYAVGIVIGFIVPHLYIYWAIHYSEGFIWGNWSSWSDILHYFGGNDYIQNEHAWSYVLQNSLTWIAWMGAFGGLAWLVISSFLLLKESLTTLGYWWLCLFLATGIFPLTYKIYWPEIPDFSAYLLPCLSLSLSLIWTLYGTLSKLSQKLMLIAFLISGSFLNNSPITQRSRSDHNLPLTMAQNWLEGLPQGALLFLESDHWVFPIMYAQNYLGIRPDILVFNVGFSRSSWYWSWLQKQHPDMPSISELQQNKGLRTRLASLALSYNHVYSESAQLAVNLSLQNPLLQSQPCPSSWGYNVSCQSPLPLPKAELIRSWAQNPTHRDPITRRVLARLGLNGMQALWSQKKTKEALDFALAAIGEEAITHKGQETAWWPVPPQVWQAAQVGLIGSPQALEALINSLSHR